MRVIIDWLWCGALMVLILWLVGYLMGTADWLAGRINDGDK